ncbi:MAG: DUF4249 family protein [Bacteroidales bacterium]|nr:DUF4249 family protein [Bacteroidales bacterium]
MNRTISSFSKFIFIPGIVLLLSACITEIDIDTSGTSDEIVVSCYFTDSLPWNVQIYNTFSLNEYAPSEPVTNAQVTITENDKTITLQHSGNGLYTAGEYPETGVTYNLLVQIEGREEIRAQSSVPFKSEISGISVDPTERTIITAYGPYSELICTDFTITPAKNVSTLCSVRLLEFDTITGYNRYYFDEDCYERMLEKGVDPKVVNSLGIFNGQIIFGPLWNVLTVTLGEMPVFGYTAKIEESTFLDRVDYRDPAAFLFRKCASQAGVFYQAPYETYTLFGNFSEKTPVDVFINPFYYSERSEHWLEFMDLSPEYYQFQKDYSLQISIRGDISNPPVIVYSNIENATGIFAGYQKQLFMLDDLVQNN